MRNQETKAKSDQLLHFSNKDYGRKCSAWIKFWLLFMIYLIPYPIMPSTLMPLSPCPFLVFFSFFPIFPFPLLSLSPFPLSPFSPFPLSSIPYSLCPYPLSLIPCEAYIPSSIILKIPILPLSTLIFCQPFSVIVFQELLIPDQTSRLSSQLHILGAQSWESANTSINYGNQNRIE